MSGGRSRRIDFFQFVSWVQRRARRAADLGHLGPRGLDLDPEALRIRPHLSLSFPARDIEEVRSIRQDPPQLRVDVNFGGVYGSDSPLPTAFTEELLRDDYVAGAEDLEGVRHFLDIFHHRLYSLLFRAWQSRRYAATFDGEGGDQISGALLALAGLGTEGLAEAASADGALPALQPLRHAALRAQRPRAAGALRAALRDHLGERVRIESFVLRTVEVQPRDRTYLGGARLGGKRVPARRLGADTTVGTRVQERSTRLRVVIGPLARDRFERLLPGTPGRDGVDALVRQLCPLHIEPEVVLELDEAQPVGTVLGDTGAEARLGQTTWVSSEEQSAAPARLPGAQVAC